MICVEPHLWYSALQSLFRGEVIISERPSRYVNIQAARWKELNCVPQIVPHVTNAIQDWIERVSKIPVDDTGEEPDVCIVEVRSIHVSRLSMN